MTVDEIKSKAIKAARKVKKEDLEEAINFFEEDENKKSNILSLTKAEADEEIEKTIDDIKHKLKKDKRKNIFGVLGTATYVGQGSIKELTAQEMFEQLGYTKYEDEFELIFSKEFYYHYKNKLERKIISFMKSDKRLDLSIFTDFMTMEELKAINKQCKELRWL